MTTQHNGAFADAETLDAIAVYLDGLEQTAPPSMTPTEGKARACRLARRPGTPEAVIDWAETRSEDGPDITVGELSYSLRAFVGWVHAEDEDDDLGRTIPVVW